MPLGLNGGIVGPINQSSNGSATGVWTLDQVNINRLNNLWPLDNRPVSIRLFTESTTWVTPQDVISIEYLVVAGGGGGGTETGLGDYRSGGGGGAGGYRTGKGYPVTPNSTLTVVVGSGGAGCPSTNPAFSPVNIGANGTNSGFYTSTTSLWSTGGGGGGSTSGQNGRAGGSGGGGGTNGTLGGAGNLGGYTPSEGNRGSHSTGQYASGGGGGAGNTAPDGTSDAGAGLFNSISGANTLYAFGGSGGMLQSTYIPPASTGGGGSGGSAIEFTGLPGINGASGIVIFRWA